MNGFISKCGRRLMLLAAVAGGATGCRTLDTSCGSPCNANQCASGSCGSGCAECGPDGCLFGGAFAKFKDGCKDFDPEQLHTDHCWPDQYNRLSRQRVRDPLGQQMQNGIAIETTLWTHYFSSEKDKEAELTEAGRSRLQYLARRKPYVVPNLHLQTSFDRNIDAKRIESAIEFLNKVSMEPQPWHVAIVNAKPTGLFGVEGPKAITKMVGLQNNPPLYEQQIKQNFFQSDSGSGGGGGGAGGGSGS